VCCPPAGGQQVQPAGPVGRLTVTDNGQGFDIAADHQGFGLKSMAARLDEIGGRLQITSAPGDTRLVAEVPTAAPGPGDTGSEPGARTDVTMPGATA